MVERQKTEEILQAISNNKPFTLYCNCSVKYEGRAYSTLEPGNYLIIFKEDCSIQIHGSNKIQPRNYQGSKTKIEYQDDKLICINKKEKITISINELITLNVIENWSSHEIKISRTESELVEKISKNISSYIDISFALGSRGCVVEREYKTENGPIDLFAYTLDHGHLIEVKRRKANVTDGCQLNKYHEAVLKQDISVPKLSCYLAAPAIGKNAQRYLDDKGYKFIEINWDD